MAALSTTARAAATSEESGSSFKKARLDSARAEVGMGELFTDPLMGSAWTSLLHENKQLREQSVQFRVMMQKLALGVDDSAQTEGFVIPALPVSLDDELRSEPNRFRCHKPNTTKAILLARGCVLPPCIASSAGSVTLSSTVSAGRPAADGLFRHPPHLVWLEKRRVLASVMTEESSLTARSSWEAWPLETTEGEAYPSMSDRRSPLSSCSAFIQLRHVLQMSGAALVNMAMDFAAIMREMAVESPMRVEQRALDVALELEQIQERVSRVPLTDDQLRLAKMLPQKVDVVSLGDAITERAWHKMMTHPTEYLLRLDFAMAFANSLGLRHKMINLHEPSLVLQTTWIWSCLFHLLDANSTFNAIHRAFMLLVLTPPFLPTELFSHPASCSAIRVFFDCLLRMIVWSYQHGSEAGLLRCVIACSAVNSLVSLRRLDFQSMKIFDHESVHLLLQIVYEGLLSPCASESCLQKDLTRQLETLLEAAGLLALSSKEDYSAAGFHQETETKNISSKEGKDGKDGKDSKDPVVFDRKHSVVTVGPPRAVVAHDPGQSDAASGSAHRLMFFFFCFVFYVCCI